MSRQTFCELCAFCFSRSLLSTFLLQLKPIVRLLLPHPLHTYIKIRHVNLLFLIISYYHLGPFLLMYIFFVLSYVYLDLRFIVKRTCFGPTTSWHGVDVHQAYVRSKANHAHCANDHLMDDYTIEEEMSRDNFLAVWIRQFERRLEKIEIALLQCINLRPCVKCERDC